MDRLFRLEVGLQLPPGSKGPTLEKGAEATETQLVGLNVDALLSRGFLTEMPQKLKCDACQDSGSAADKKKTYVSLLDLRDHYGAEHPALAAPAAETEV